jgi:DNA-binding SARP family transcriptional activator
VEFGVLGPLEVRAGSDVVSIRHGLPRALLIALLLRTGQTVSASFLIDVLRGEDLPRNPANALQIQVSYLRKKLAGGASDGTAPLETRPGGYSLVAEPAAIDVFRFEAAMRDLPPPDTLLDELAVRHALDHVDAALEMWRGQALEDVATMDFARGEITRLEEMRSAALERRMDLLLLLGRHNDVVSDLS